jgi:hypothetical protein
VPRRRRRGAISGRANRAIGDTGLPLTVARDGQAHANGTRAAIFFEAVRSCGFHDHLDPTGVAGRIEVRIE